MIKRTLTIDNDLDESTKLYPFIGEVGFALHLDEVTLSPINLAIEEAVVNSIQYAYPKGTKGKIELMVEWDEEKKQLVFTLKDQGVPFNPLAAKEADTTLGVQERPIGGLGILLLRKLMSNVAYERTADGFNVLTMTKDLGKGIYFSSLC